MTTHNGARINSEKIELAYELHKAIIRHFKKRKVHSSFKSKIWTADFVDIQLISKYNTGIRSFLCAIAVYSGYAWTLSLIEKKDITIANSELLVFMIEKVKNIVLWIVYGGKVII